MKTTIFLALSLTFVFQAQANSNRFNGRYELIHRSTISDEDCSPQIEITSTKNSVIMRSDVPMERLGAQTLAYPQWKTNQTLELKDQTISQGSCAKKDPIDCFTSGATSRTLTTKNTVSATSINAGSYLRHGPIRMTMEMNLSKNSKTLYYSMKFKHRDPNQGLNKTVKLSCYYELQE